MAFGARSVDVLGLILRQGMLLVGVGIALGWVGAVMLTRLLESELYRVSPLDPITFLGVAAGMAGIAFLAHYLPARQATRTNPVDSLRYD